MGFTNRSEIIFNGVSSKTVNLYIEKGPDYVIPERDYEETHVPGRNGDIIVDSGSFKNVDRTYGVSFGDENEELFVSLASAVASWLHTASGYATLKDSYEPEYIRMAYYKDSGSFENILSMAGKGELKFKCKPQRYLVAGMTPVTLVGSTAFNNPTVFNAKPDFLISGTWNGSIDDMTHDLIRIRDSSEQIVYTIAFNPKRVLALLHGIPVSEVPSLTDKSYSFTVNGELQDIYGGDRNEKNLNGAVKLAYGYPELTPGRNSIGAVTGGDISSVKVTPRWWII